MILQYEEAVEQALDASNWASFEAVAMACFLLAIASAIVAFVMLFKDNETKALFFIVTTFVILIALGAFRDHEEFEILKNAGLNSESLYYATQLNEKYDITIMPNAYQGYYWWNREFYAVSKDTGEVKAYRLDEIEDGYLTLFDVEDGKAISIHQ